MSELPPVSQEVLVAADPATAFAVFTEQLGSWWPMDFSVYGAGATAGFRDGRLVEHSAGQADAVWGEVTEWSPPSAVAFSWHPGRDADRASQVRVEFTPQDRQTLVRLEHTGWQTFTDPAAARARYDEGWPTVLTPFGLAVAQAVGVAASD